MIPWLYCFVSMRVHFGLWDLVKISTARAMRPPPWDSLHGEKHDGSFSPISQLVPQAVNVGSPLFSHTISDLLSNKMI